MSSASPGARLRELATGALLGPDRSGTGGATELLTAAAVLGAKSRAGWKPRRVDTQMTPCPVDARPLAPRKTLATLARLLADPDAGLIEEWAELALHARVRVDDAAAPVLLDWWSRQPRRPESVSSLLGERGVWLASLNDAWRKPIASDAIPANAEELWQTGTAAERAAVLLSIRRQDPARALSMIQSTWSADGADERRRFVEVLQTGLALADEPFLEAALDDKGKSVRRQAASVLASLPGSRLRSRMNERSAGIITVEHKRGIVSRSVKVSLTPPAEFDKAWERDGIESQAGSGVGKRAWWMRQILAAADLKVWTDVTGLDPEKILDAIASDDYYDDALLAIVQSARTNADPAWCAAIVPRMLERKNIDFEALAELWSALPLEQSENLRLEAIAHKRMNQISRWTILVADPRGWTLSFSRQALELLRAHGVVGSDAWQAAHAISLASHRVAPQAAEGFEQTAMAMFKDDPTDSIKKSIDRARLRSDMHKEFAS